jgi:restriction endonuclease S subunit
LKNSDIKRIPILIPPLKEQEDIVASVAERSEEIEARLSEFIKKLASLRHLRTLQTSES